MGKFVMKKVNTGWHFNLEAGNGEVIAVSEVYTSTAACKKGIASVKKNAGAAGLEDQTEGGAAKNPKFEVYKDKGGQFRFRLKARNGKIIAASEGYTSKSGCENGIDSVRRNAPGAAIEMV